MAKTEVTQWDTTAANNLDVNSISLAENVMRPPAVNNAFREMMAQLRRMLNSSIFRLFDTTDITKIAAFDLSGITTGTTRTLTVPDENGTIQTRVATTTDNAIARYDGTTGKQQNSSVTIDDAGAMIIAAGADKQLTLTGTSAPYLSLVSNGTERGRLIVAGGSDCSLTAIGPSTPVTFVANGNERARIESGGRFLLGSVGGIASGASRMSLTYTGGVNENGLNFNTTDSGTSTPVRFTFNGSTSVGSISQTTTTTSYNTTSDERLKTNFQDFDSGAIIDGVGVYHYDWNVGGSAYGFKAQQLHEVFPDAVRVGSVQGPDEDGFDPWSVDPSKLVVVLWREVQGLRARLTAAGL